MLLIRYNISTQIPGDYLKNLLMKTIQEVCKIVGITRRTLQEYDRIGLLSPSNNNRNKYEPWLYSNEDIKTLIQIQLYTTSGYERKEIKENISKIGLTPSKTISDAIYALETKRIQINQQLQNLRLLELIIHNLKQSHLSISEEDLSYIFNARSFNDRYQSKDPIDSDFCNLIKQINPEVSRCILNSIKQFYNH